MELKSVDYLASVLLSSPIGFCLLDAQSLVSQLVNDAFIEIAGKPRDAIEGKYYWDSFKEAAPYYESALAGVIETGITFRTDETELTLIRYGKEECVYVTFVYEAVKDENGTIQKVGIWVLENTQQVKSRQKIQELNEELATSNEEQMSANEELVALNDELAATNDELKNTQTALQFINENLTESESRFRRLVQQAPVAIFVLRGKEMVFETVNDLMYRMLGKSSEIIGQPYAKAVPELIGQPFFDLLDRVYNTGETYYGSEIKGTLTIDGIPTDGYFNFIYQAVRDDSGQVSGIMCVAVDVIEQVNSRKVVEQAEENLRIATESGELGTWYYESTTGRFVSSTRFNQLFGLPADSEPSYEEALSRIFEEDQARVNEAVNISIHNNTAYKTEYRVLAEDNKIRWIKAVGKVIGDNESNRFITGIVSDITEQKGDEQRKNDFIAMVSHEMKTPLTSMNGYLQILELKATQNVDSFTVNMSQKARKQINKMTSLINGFLNVSRLESGKIQIDKTRFDMAVMMKEAGEEIQSTINSHKVIFHPVETTWINADQDKINQVINNLISNAVKYSPANTVITVSCFTTDGCATVSVTDRGIGIKKEDQPKLFDRYYRVNNDNATSASGFGIGLYLSAEIIKRHEGKIWVESEVGKGSTFAFSLPVVE